MGRIDTLDIQSISAMSYTPIDCNYYDRLEAHATLRQRVSIEYYGDGVSKITVLKNALIVDLQTRNKVEFMILEGGQEIRLDKLIAVDGKEVPKSC